MRKKSSEQSRLSNLKRLVPCQVCGMSSSGRHYGVFSCEGCRNFFKRSLVAHTYYSCRHSPETPSSNCKLCRFNACLAAGMSTSSARVGRPTAEERAAVAAYVTQLEAEHRLLSTTDDVKEEIPAQTKSSVTDQVCAQSSFGNGCEDLLHELEQRVIGASQFFNQFNDFEYSVTLDWQMSPQVVWNLMVGSQMEFHIASAANYTRSLPGFSKVDATWRPYIFAKAAFPLLAARCLHSAFTNSSLYPGAVAAEAIYSFFSFSRQVDSWSVASQTIGAPMGQFENVMVESAQLLLELGLNESEFAVLYALIFFNKPINGNEPKSQMESLSKVYAQAAENLAQQHLSSLPGQRVFSLISIAASLNRVTEIMVNVHWSLMGDGNSLAGGESLFNEIIQQIVC